MTLACPTETRVRGPAAAPQVRIVDHVVMEKRGGVDELDHCGKFMGIGTPVPTGSRGEDEKNRAQPLAAPANDVLAHLTHKRDG